MKNIVGIIVEFNPLHKGHIEHIIQTRRNIGADYVIAVMSGHFVQRGEPAIINKFARTREALLNGVDVVIEIPVVYATAAADYFARGSVGLLDACGVVGGLSFGSESGNIVEIVKAGEILAQEPAAYKKALRAGLDGGLSFAGARGRALEVMMGDVAVSEGFFTKPNNCLGVEYVKALRLLGNPMAIHTTHRKSGGATATRARAQMHQGAKYPKLDDFSDMFKYAMMMQPSVADTFGEGLGNRFFKHINQHHKISDLLMAVKTKRYTHTRLQRHVMRTVLGITPSMMDNFENGGGVQYVRVLGFRRSGAEVVGQITGASKLPVITTGRDMDKILAGGGLAGEMLQAEFRAGDIYNIVAGEAQGQGYFSERGAGLVIVDG